MALYRGTPLEIESNEEESMHNLKNQYKKRFERLTDKEVEIKLKLNLEPQAIEALQEILEERKNALQHEHISHDGRVND